MGFKLSRDNGLLQLLYQQITEIQSRLSRFIQIASEVNSLQIPSVSLRRISTQHLTLCTYICHINGHRGHSEDKLSKNSHIATGLRVKPGLLRQFFFFKKDLSAIFISAYPQPCFVFKTCVLAYAATPYQYKG